MSTDFSYGGKQIITGGPIKPSGKDMPLDARTRINTYSEKETIPNPFVGMIVTVLTDENNNNKMTDYKVKSLKANSAGIANMVIDEMIPYVDYLGVSSSGGGTGEGLTTEQAQQLTTAYEHSQSDHVSMDEVNQAIANAQLGGGEVDLSAYATKTYADNAISTALDGHTFKFLTQAEYDSLETKNPLVEYHITDTTGSGEGLTTEQAQQLQTAYEHSQQQHVSFDDLNNVDAVSVNGYSFSRLMTLEEYNNLAVKDSNTIYLVIDDGSETPTKTLSSISAVYTQGDTVVYPSTSLDSLKSNLVVTASYSDSSTSTISNYSLSGTLTVGTSIIRVTYGGKTTTFNVTVTQDTKTLTSISAVYNQGSTAVYPSTNLDSLKNNLTVTATYSDNSNSVISSGYSLSGNLTVGTSTITVTYSGKTTTFNVIVSEEITPTKKLTSITAVYTQGDTVVHPSTALNNLKSNLVVTANYDDDSTEKVTDYTLSGELSVGNSAITVTYSGKTTTFNVTVTEETTIEMDSAYSYLRVTVPAGATTEQSTLYLSKPTGGTMNSLYINDVSKDVPSGVNQTTTGYSLNEGENIIKIKGNFTCWNSKCNINVIQLQKDLTTCKAMCYGCSDLVFSATIPSTVTNTASMFQSSSISKSPAIPDGVLDTSEMFRGSLLVTASTVPNSVQTCSSMYESCDRLEGTVNVSSSVTNLQKYLNGAGKNGTGIILTGINTDIVTNYQLAFFNAKITTIEQSFADLIKQPKPGTVTNAVCFRSTDTNLSSPITIAEVHSDWKQ